MSAKISLITTVYNRSNFLAAAIESILAQTYPHFDFLIWDDGSTDDSVTIAQQYAQQDPRIRVIAAPHKGIAPSLKNAIAQTHAPYLGWVDSDDLLAPTALAETLPLLEANPTIGMVYTDYEVIDPAGISRGLGKKCQIPYSKDRLLLDFMTFHFRLIRRRVYEQVGGIDPSYQLAEDYDLCLKLSEVGEIEHLKRPLYYHRRHHHNITNNQVAGIEWASRAIEQALHRRGLSQHYSLEVQIVGHFHLHPKSDAPPLSLTPTPSPTPPKVSIIIPCFNPQQRLHACLTSCFEQSYPNLEIIVVDNRSTDGSLSYLQHVAQQSPHPMQVLSCKTQGANYARNAGFLAAQGDYIQWLDADDELGPDKIAQQVAALEAHPDAEIAYSDWHWYFHREHTAPIQFIFPERDYDDILLQLLLDNWRPPHAYLLRRTAAQRLHQLRAWNPKTEIYTDREYFTLAALLGFKFRYVSGPWVTYHFWSLSQMSRLTSYAQRVSSLRVLFDRFQDVACLQLIPEHRKTIWFLLSQDWHLWHPAFTLERVEGTCYLRHSHHALSHPLTPIQARLAEGLISSCKPRTLEDHARYVIRNLWIELLLEYPPQASSTSEIDFDLLSQELARRVGLPISPAVSAPGPQEKQRASASIEDFDPFLLDLPLLSPLFAEQRLAVLIFLDRLRQQGWLKQANNPAPDEQLFTRGLIQC